MNIEETVLVRQSSSYWIIFSNIFLFIVSVIGINVSSNKRKTRALWWSDESIVLFRFFAFYFYYHGWSLFTFQREIIIIWIWYIAMSVLLTIYFIQFTNKTQSTSKLKVESHINRHWRSVRFIVDPENGVQKRAALKNYRLALF